MTKASLTLPNGTVVQIDGTAEEVQALLAYYGSGAPLGPTSPSGRVLRPPGASEGRRNPPRILRIPAEVPIALARRIWLKS